MNEELLTAYANVLEFITNSFYRTDENTNIAVTINNEGHNYYDRNQITLSKNLMEAFHSISLPKFLIYYHELGHHLYSIGSFKLEETWKTITQPTILYHSKYNHLMNWIEDYYIERKLIQEHPYLTDVVTCIKKLPLEYDINRIEYAFNYWYIHEAPTSALSYPDQLSFKAYVLKLLQLRASTATRFGHGIINTLSIKLSTETQFIMTLMEFHQWCVDRKILPDEEMPNLDHPTQAIVSNGPQSGQGNNTGDGGSHTPHSGNIGKTTYTKVFQVKNDNFKDIDDLVNESKLIRKEILDMSKRMQADNHTLDGLFNTKLKDSAFMQPRVIVPNFFNPHRLIDQVLFREKLHSYMNVAIYRDISGSVDGDIHTLMNKVCEYLYQEIPVDITFYLYGSGDTSIIEVPFVSWDDYNKEPKEYTQNPLFQNLERGTNSSAIADVISQQLSEKWLNIVITDGDLDDLMKRDNIHTLLENVFAIFVGNKPDVEVNGLLIEDEHEIPFIVDKLSNIKGGH
jgi:hypothetical protein